MKLFGEPEAEEVALKFLGFYFADQHVTTVSELEARADECAGDDEAQNTLRSAARILTQKGLGRKILLEDDLPEKIT